MQFIITSVIDYPKYKLSYTGTRSAFSIEERLEQTKKTIMSVQQYAPQSLITLVELGLTDYTNEFRTYQNLIYLYRGKRILTKLTIRSPWKNNGYYHHLRNLRNGAFAKNTTDRHYGF